MTSRTRGEGCHMPESAASVPGEASRTAAGRLRASLTETAPRLVLRRSHLPSSPTERSRHMRRASRADELQTLPAIGPSLAADLRALGVRRVADLKRRDPERLYA